MTSQTQALLIEAKQEIASKYNFDTWDEAEMINYKAFPKMIEEVAVEFHTRLLAEAGKEVSINDILMLQWNEAEYGMDLTTAKNILDFFSPLLAAKQGENELLRQKIGRQEISLSQMESQLEAAQKEIERLNNHLAVERESQAHERERLLTQLSKSKAEVERLKEVIENRNLHIDKLTQ